MSNHSVYALCDPRTGNIRYIGQAVDIHKRYAQHLLYSAEGGAKKAWLDELKQEGKLPTMIILESGLTAERIYEREMYWIAFHLERGAALTNIALPSKRSISRQCARTVNTHRHSERVSFIPPSPLSTAKERDASIQKALRELKIKPVGGFIKPEDAPRILRLRAKKELGTEREYPNVRTNDLSKLFWQSLEYWQSHSQ